MIEASPYVRIGRLTNSLAYYEGNMQIRIPELFNLVDRLVAGMQHRSAKHAAVADCAGI